MKNINLGKLFLVNINLGKLFLVLISLPITAAIFATFTEIDLMKYFGWFGDEVGFVYVMVLFIYIAGYLAWNVNNKVIESEKPNRKSGNLVFLVTLGVGYSLVCIALPVWITQGPFKLDDFEQFFVLILLVFVVLCISIYLNNYAKKKCAKQMTKRMVFLRRMAFIHIWSLGVILILALNLVFNGGLMTI